MCGIAGQVRHDGATVDPALLGALCDAVEHRGPDARGLFFEPRAGLGIQRLRVVDLETGDQPVFTEDGQVAVVLNGEIYDFGQQRKRLARDGHLLATRGDTEVIAHLYEEHGIDCVRHLRGMFALALWDAPRGRLLLARDRVGKKPLFYAFRAGVLTFASSIAALLRDPEVGREVDPQAIDAFLTLGYVPDPWSAFRAIRKLPPACTLVLEPGGEPRIERFWSLDRTRRLDVRSEQEAGELVRDALRAATRRRMVADVPLGAFLSGGVDSSGVVAAMAEASSRPVRTFSIGFGDPAHDERAAARLVAQAFATDHTELEVTPDAAGLLVPMARHFGEPFADSSAVPSFELARLARAHVTVALNGDGGDEAFGGYGRQVTAASLARADVLPAALRRAVAAAVRRVPPGPSATATRARLVRAAGQLPRPAAERYLQTLSRGRWDRRAATYAPAFAVQLDDAATAGVVLGPWEREPSGVLLDRMLAVELASHLPGDLLVKMDVATMAVALEARSPLLDHELLELAAALPERLRVDGPRKKVALRAALRGWVPDAVLDKPKQGFQVPLAAWLRGPLGPRVAHALDDPAAAVHRYVRPEVSRVALTDHLAGRADHGSFLWSLLVLQTWHEEVVDRPAEVPARVLA